MFKLGCLDTVLREVLLGFLKAVFLGVLIGLLMAVLFKVPLDVFRASRCLYGLPKIMGVPMVSQLVL